MTAPVQTPSAPAAAEVSQSGPFGIDDALASISSSAIAQTLAEQTTPDSSDVPPTGDQPRGPDGKFVPRESTAPANAAETDTPTAEPTDATPEPDADVADAPALPEGMVAIPTVTDRELATTFKVLDAQGELDVPDLTIEFHANGKTRKEPLDKVVRLAERGVYNEEREQQVLAQRHEAQAVRQENAQLKAILQQAQIERERLLSSDDAYLMARAQYEEANTPDARLARLQETRAQEQTQQLYSQAVAVSNQYFEATVLPAVEQIATQLGTVTPDEIGARLVLLTNHLRVPLPDGDSFIPPAKHQAVGEIILRDIVPWASALHEERDTSTKAGREQAERARKDAEAKARDAQVNAQKAKNLVGKQIRSTGRATNPSSTRQTPPPKPIKTVEDAEQAALRDTLAALV